MKNSKRAGVVSATAATLVIGGVAFAAWTSTDQGDGAVSATTDTGITVTQTGTATGLFPTGEQNVLITVTNDNPYPVEVTSLVKVGDVKASGEGIPSDCNVETHKVSFTQFTTQAGAPEDSVFTLAAADEDGDAATYTMVASMGSDSDEACKGATFTQTYEATADSSIDNAADN